MYLKPSLTQRSPVLFFLFFKTTLAEICTDSEASHSSHSTNKTNTQLWARRAVSPLSPPPCYNWTLQRAEGKKERKEGGKEGGKLGKENKKVSYFSKLLRLHRDDSNMPNDAWSTSRFFFFLLQRSSCKYWRTEENQRQLKQQISNETGHLRREWRRRQSSLTLDKRM